MFGYMEVDNAEAVKLQLLRFLKLELPNNSCYAQIAKLLSASLLSCQAEDAKLKSCKANGPQANVAKLVLLSC